MTMGVSIAYSLLTILTYLIIHLQLAQVDEIICVLIFLFSFVFKPFLNDPCTTF